MAKAEKPESFVWFIREMIDGHMSRKISKDGLVREEDVEVLSGMYDEFGRKIRRGSKVRQYLHEMQQESDDRTYEERS